MSKQRDQDFLSNVREAIQRIAAYTEGMTYKQLWYRDLVDGGNCGGDEPV